MFKNDWVTFDEILYLKSYETAIASDIHFGSSKDLNYTKNKLLDKMDDINPQKLVINGDLYYLHTDKFNENLYHDMLIQFIHSLNNKVDKLVYLEGNHELHTEEYPHLTEDIQLNVGKYHKIHNTVITHGHINVNVEANNYIIGHVHPRKQGEDVYHYKSKEYKNGNLTIMPAFANKVNGVDINNYDGKCPIIGNNTEEYKHLKVKDT